MRTLKVSIECLERHFSEVQIDYWGMVERFERNNADYMLSALTEMLGHELMDNDQATPERQANTFSRLIAVYMVQYFGPVLPKKEIVLAINFLSPDNGSSSEGNPEK